MTAKTERHLHYIEHRHEDGYGIRAKFTCKGDRSSPCHQYPPEELGMEQWGEQDRHLFVSHDKCWIQFLMDRECGVLCGPDGEHVRPGPEPITVEFDDCILWEYAEPSHAAQDAERAS